MFIWVLSYRNSGNNRLFHGLVPGPFAVIGSDERYHHLELGLKAKQPERGPASV
jgi:hypothetical protein